MHRSVLEVLLLATMYLIRVLTAKERTTRCKSNSAMHVYPIPNVSQDKPILTIIPTDKGH